MRDEIDQYPDDLDGQGDPLEISDGRLISFLASGDWRKADVSTPTLKGGSPRLVDIDLAGHRVAKGAKIWPVGTWPLKGAFFADLREEGRRSGAESDPSGYCHFPTWLDDGFFRQITSEYVAKENRAGRRRKVWKQLASHKDNHQLDTTVYCRALAEHLGLSSLTSDEWARLAKERGGAPADDTPLFAAAARAEPTPQAAEPPAHADDAPADDGQNDIDALIRENAGLFN